MTYLRSERARLLVFRRFLKIREKGKPVDKTVIIKIKQSKLLPI